MLYFKKTIKISLILTLFAISISCRKEDNHPADEVIRQEVYNAMRDDYLWNDSIPKSIDPLGFPDAQSIISSLRVNVDRWSHVSAKSTYQQYYEEGKYEGLGFMMAWDTNDSLRVGMVYKQSSAGIAGMKRGDVFLEINNTKITADTDINGLFENMTLNSTYHFKLKRSNGETYQADVSVEVVTMNTVLKDTILTINGNKVGYLSFKGFIEPSVKELTTVFTDFLNAGVQEVVLDLRYNGGGRMDVAMFLANALVPPANSNSLAFKIIHNQNHQGENETGNFESSEYNLGLSRLFVIATGGTASASELVINCLKPYMQVIQIGDDSYGKPVGSYGQEAGKNDEYIISVINMKILNANNEGDYFDGLPADAYVPDDLTHHFGDPQEACFKEALHYIEHGAFSISTKSGYYHKQRSIRLSGFRQEIGAF